MQPCTCPCCALRLLLAPEMDEFLVWYVQDYHCRAARDELFERHGDKARTRVARLCRAARVQAADAADLQQDVFLVLDDAIHRYKFAYFYPPRPCHFRTFLHQRLVYHVRDFLAGRRRDRRRDDRVLRQTAQVLSGAAPRGPGDWLAPPPEWAEEPSLLAEQGEALAGLRHAVDALAGEKRAVWEDLLAGGAPKAVARHRGWSPATVRRERRRMISRMAAFLCGHWG